MTVLPWQQPVYDAILQACADEHLASAVGITSDPGWGLPQLLDAVTKGLLAIEDDRSARDIAHKDLWWKIPERERPEKTEFVIDLVRQINEFAVKKPQTAPRKVIVVENAHRLNRNAANALLKILEEPPPDTHLLVATEYWGRLLPTIRSRCQRYVVPANAARAREWLQTQGHALDEQHFAQLGYAPMHIATGEDVGDFDAWVVSLNRVSLTRAVQEVMAKDVADWLARWFRYINAQLLNGHDATQAAASARQLELLAFAEEIVTARRQLMTTSSANTRALLEMLIVRWQRMPG